MKTLKNERVEDVRRQMKTLPDNSFDRAGDEIFYDLESLRVEIVGHPVNPYKSIHVLVTSTWGSREKWWTRWEDATPESRMKVVEAALQGLTLPASLETSTFVFKVQGVSRASFDQWARHRQYCIGSVGSRDDNHVDAALIVPRSLKKYDSELRKWWKDTKDLYEKMVGEGKESWQSARFILPSGMEWRWTMGMNYRAFRDSLAQRFCFCEQGDTVALAWLLWKSMYDLFPLLAAYTIPTCDKLNKCLYSKTYTLGEMFSNLFLPCGRHPTPVSEYCIFNDTSTSAEEVSELLGFKVPEPDEWEEIQKKAWEKDAKYFED